MISSNLQFCNGTPQENFEDSSIDPKFAYVWDPLVPLMNKFSSIWWFFLMLPKYKGAYGPKQAMFTFATRRAEIMNLNGRWTKGMAALSPKPVQSLNGVATGWYYDGNQMHEDLTFLTGPMTLDAFDRSLQIRAPHIDESLRVHADGDYFARTRQNGNEFTLEFQGPKSSGDLRFWQDRDCDLTSPFVLNKPLRMGSVHMLALRYMNFEGHIETEAGKEYLEGIGYFQKVMMNVPMFPWMWHWSATEDGNALSYFTAYAGYQSLRRKNRPWSHSLESHTKNIIPNAYYFDRHKRRTYEFQNVAITPEIRKKKVYFRCDATSPEKDEHLHFRCYPHAHTKFITKRPLGMGISSKFNYNEYAVRVGDLRLRVGGEDITLDDTGRIYGNCEYTWGLAL